MDYRSAIKTNLDTILDTLSRACARSGRTLESVKLIAVSKTQNLEKIMAALSCGLTIFGESRAQELIDRFSRLESLPEVHFIGHLQRNKVAKVLPYVTTVHSVDRAETAREISLRACASARTIGILYEVNTGGEDNKEGVHGFESLKKLIDDTAGLPGLVPRGLMTMAPWNAGEKIIRGCFSMLREFRERLSSSHAELEMNELSMGMSSDYVYAVEEGATMVRIGTQLFGDRNV